MARLQVTTKDAEQVWQSPDGKITIFKVSLEYEGKAFEAKTYSKAIATVGWSGEVESYKKPGRNGDEAFVKQPQKEGGFGGSRRDVDPFTMYLSYSKDLAIAMLDKGVVDEAAFGEVLNTILLGGKTLYEGRPTAQAQEVSETPAVEKPKGLPL